MTGRDERAGQSAESGGLDLTLEDESRLPEQSRQIDLRELPLQPYDPRPQEDKARRNIAYALIGLLFLVVFAVIGLVGTGAIGVADIKEFGVIIGPLVALVSAATGFYYGNR